MITKDFRHPKGVPTAQEERELALRVRDGDKAARTELIERNIPMVFKVLGNSESRHRQDIQHAGFQGLIKAVDEFDPDNGNRLFAYAQWWIRQRANEERMKFRIVHIPAYLESERDLETKLETNRITPEQATSLKRAAERAKNIQALPEEHDQYEDNDPHDLVVLQEEVSEVMEAFGMLEAKEKEILARRIGLNGPEETHEQICKTYGVTREMTRKIEQKALKKMAKILGIKDAEPWSIWDVTTTKRKKKA